MVCGNPAGGRRGAFQRQPDARHHPRGRELLHGWRDQRCAKARVWRVSRNRRRLTRKKLSHTGHQGCTKRLAAILRVAFVSFVVCCSRKSRSPEYRALNGKRRLLDPSLLGMTLFSYLRKLMVASSKQPALWAGYFVAQGMRN